jgi:hypothetical protein
LPPLLAVWFSLGGCEKVPIVDIEARFALADFTWYAEEDTLFVFYRVDAEQGLGPASQIELAYRTDESDLGWTPLAELSPVHTHLPVDCGSRARCGSTSLHIPRVPRQVRLRLRFHRDGETTLDAPVAFNVVGRGPAHTNRSLLVYGVFDESNGHVEWRVRHQFPSLRNEEVRALGLRRNLRVTDPRHGEVPVSLPDNPYGYAFAAACPPNSGPLGLSKYGFEVVGGEHCNCSFAFGDGVLHFNGEVFTWPKVPFLDQNRVIVFLEGPCDPHGPRLVVAIVANKEILHARLPITFFNCRGRLGRGLA